MSQSTIQIPVDLTNPGQFFACCGLLEVTDQLWPGAEGWFEEDFFRLAISAADMDKPFAALIRAMVSSTVGNTMSATQINRLEELSAMPKRQRIETPGLEEEKKVLESLRREEPIVLGTPIRLRIDWFHDDNAGGSRFKTWAGQQSVLDIATAMKEGVQRANIDSESAIWNSARGIGLPFNFGHQYT